MLEKIRELLENQLSIDASSVTEETAFKEDLGADSLDLFEMIMSLEDAYGIEIPTEDLENIVTVGDIMKYLAGQGITE